MKCPNCGAKFILKDNIYQCKYCGYTESIEKNEDKLIEVETESLNENSDENDEEEYDDSKDIKIKSKPKKRYINNTNYNGTKTKRNDNSIEIGDNLTFLLFLGFVLIVYIISYFIGEGY